MASYANTPLSEAGKDEDEKSDASGLSVAEITCAEDFQSAMHGPPTKLAKALKNIFRIYGKR